MATLEEALPYLKDDEGEWSDIAGDSGGETFMGIARLYHPEWAGWGIIDQLALPIHNAAACDNVLDADPRMEPLVLAFYRRTYWNFDGLNSQAVASKVFDGAVNMEGNGRMGAAITALQKAINVQFPAIPMTPGYGPNTELAANKCDPEGLLMDLARFYTAHYHAIVDARPEDAKFMPDWLRRAQRLPVMANGASA